MPSRTLKPRTPRCTAAVLCERIVLDSKTLLPTLFNAFFAFKIKSEPGQSPPFALFVQMTDGLGDYEIAAELHDLDADEPLVRMARQIPLIDRLKKVNVAFAFDPITIPRIGRYDLTVTANGISVAELTLDVEPLA